MANSTDLNSIKDYYDQRIGNRQKELYDYYTGESVPVDSRTPVSSAKADTHTNAHVDFFKDIVELKVGYMAQKITPRVNIEDDVLRDRVEHELKMLERINALATANSETVRQTSISGVSHRLCFTEDGIFKIKNIPGWAVIYDYEHTPLNPSVAYYYYETIGLTGETSKHVDVYTKTEVTYYKSIDGQTAASQADLAQKPNSGASYVQIGDPQPHNFQEVPIIPILNNDMWAGDCDESTKLMDVYDEIISDTSAEIKAMRLAYLKTWGDLYTGVDSDGNEIDRNTWQKQTSMLSFGVDDDGNKFGDAEFLEKNINDQVIENILNRLRTHIYETSGSLDLRELANTERVFSIKAQMMRLENTSAITERYMRGMLYKMTRLWSFWMQEFNNINVIETDVDWNFQRTFPRDLAAEATTLSTLSSVIELEDALAALGWDNSSEIAARAKESSEAAFARNLELSIVEDGELDSEGELEDEEEDN